jgi:dTDP-4-dehydrorhamnose reductase
VILVTGALGQLGTAFRRILGDAAEYVDVDDLDLRDEAATRAAVAGLRPYLILNCAAYTAVDRAEEEPGPARDINTRVVAVLAEAAADVGAKFVTYSTDYVFDGSKPEPYVESDETNPLSVYGATKRDGEALALIANPETLVVRTSWLLSGTHPNFATTMLRLARERALSVVDDQRGHPTLVDDLAPATLAAVEAGATGVLHLANDGVTTWYGLAREVLEIAGEDPEQIQPCATADYPTPAHRPANSVLKSERVAILGLEPMPPYRPGLEQAVAEIESWLDAPKG